MLMEMPAPKPVDRTRAGSLRISLEFLHEILRLPADTEVADFIFSRETGVIELLIRGGDMPHREAGDPVERVSLICHVSRDADIESVHCGWAHKPDETWLVSQRALRTPEGTR